MYRMQVKSLLRSAITRIAPQELFSSWFTPYDKQQQLMDAILSGKYHLIVVEGSIQCGKSTPTIRAVVTRAMSWLGEYAWVNATYGQTEDAQRKLEQNVNPRAGLVMNHSRGKMEARLPNKSLIHFKSGDRPSTLYTFTANAIVMDDCHLQKEGNLELLEGRLTTTLHKGGYILAIGNVLTRQKWFYQLSRRVENNPKKGEFFISFNADDAVRGGVMSQETLDIRRESTPHDEFMRLYYNVPYDDSSMPITLTNVDNISVYEEQGVKKETPVVYGVDLGRIDDYTAIVGISANMQICYVKRMRRENWDYIYDIIASTIGDCSAYVDSTGMGGDAIYSELAQRCGGASKFIFTNSSKVQAIDNLRVALERKKVSLFRDSDSQALVEEMVRLERTFTASGKIDYHAQKGFHDDLIMALAMAYAKARASGWGVY